MTTVTIKDIRTEIGDDCHARNRPDNCDAMNLDNSHMMKRTQNRGFSLISMLVAMVIGMFIVGAGGQV